MRSLSIGTGGKPSTWFPPERLVEPLARKKRTCPSKALRSYRSRRSEKSATAVPRKQIGIEP